MAKMRKGTYHATYFVETVVDAAKLVDQMSDGVLSSFGEGDDQWEGIDMADPGAKVTITTLRSKNRNLRYDMVRVDVTCPVAEVPRGYWLSPFEPEDVIVRDAKGKDNRGEPVTWGMKFAPKKEKR